MMISRIGLTVAAAALCVAQAAAAAKPAGSAGNRVFDVRSFGAKGDGAAKDTAAIQRAVDAANAAGGGTVELPAGTYLSGTVFLKSHVDFHLAEGAVLKGSPDPADYCTEDAFPQNFASKADNTSGGHLIVAVDCEDVSLRGPGTVDGNAAAFLLDRNGHQYGGDGDKWSWKGKLLVPWRPGQMVFIVDCRSVRIENARLVNSPYWSCFILNCDSVSVKGCRIRTERKLFRTWNGDGLDIDRCTNVTVADCDIDTFDDALTLRAAYARKLKSPKDCANVTVERCRLSSSCSGVRVGVGEGVIRDCSLSKLNITDTRVAICLVSAYTPQSRGTDIRNMRFDDIDVDCEACIDVGYWTAKESEIRDITFSNIRGYAEKATRLREDTRRYKNVVFRNCTVTNRDAIPLWPEGKTPGFSEEQAVPSLTVTLPEKRTTDALLIVSPGGSYTKWCEWESRYAKFFNDRGMATVVLRYRWPRPKNMPKHVSAWQDAQRAVRICRSRAAEWKINPENIGFMGFSAGGNLTLLAATSSQTPAYSRVDAIDDLPCNVNWAVACYPAYLLSDCVNYDGGNRMKGNPLDLVLDPIFKFDAKTPPMCFMHGDADGHSPMGSVRAYHKLRTMDIPAELHVFAGRRHADLPGEIWCETVWVWLKKMEFVKDPPAKSASAPAAAKAAPAAPATPEPGSFKRLMFNNPGLEVDLGLGIWPNVEAFDYDNDGRVDIYIGSGSVPFKGSRIYMNEAPKGAPPRLFSAGIDVPDSTWKRADKGGHPSSSGLVSPHFNLKPNMQRWNYVDLDTDGVEDVVLTISDWTNYGCPGSKCPLAYDANCVWTNRPIETYAYYFRNEGGNGRNARWAKPVAIRTPNCKTDALEGPWGGAAAMFHDWDGDGDMDFICNEFIDSLWYFENIAGKGNPPRFAKGRKLRSAAGGTIAVDLCFFKSRAVDLNGDGLLDIVNAEEDGRISYCENTGRCENGVPVFLPPRFLRQKAQELKFGCLCTPFGVDWDGDGDWDFICGNSAGYIAFIENLSGPGVDEPRWAEPRCLTAGGKRIRTMAGPSGSPQGPCEAKWGYSGVSVGDWDGDGLLDILANDINGDVLLYGGISRGGTELKPGKGVEVEWNGGVQPVPAWEWRPHPGKCLRAPWRTTAEMIDWNHDGLQDIVVMDCEGYLALYERFRDTDGSLRLKHPQRIFIDEKGEPIRFSARERGGSGRARFRLADWDGDGRTDILTANWNIAFWRQVGEKDGKAVFRNMKLIGKEQLQGHTGCPATVDFDNDGRPEAVFGAEDGYFYHLANPRSKSRK